MLFDTQHILVMVVGTVLLALSLVLATIFVKSQNKKDLVLKISAIVTVIVHYSILYVDYFSLGSAEVSSTMILAVYPCNVAMWLLLIVAFMKNKEGKMFRILAEFAFYAGIVGGIFGIALNEIYSGNPNLADWDVMNGFVSHFTMMFSAIYLLTAGYIKIRVHNVLSCAVGWCIFFVDGWVVNILFWIFGKNPPDGMYTMSGPLESMPFINLYTLGIAGFVLLLVVTHIVETIKLPKQERTLVKLKQKFKKEKE